MRGLTFLSALALLLPSALCMTTNGRVGHGLIGYGIIMYKPNCATSCRASISSSPLNCTEMSHGSDHGMSDMHGSPETTPECYATDDAFLHTLAFCVSKKCPDLEDWKIEKWWWANVAGRQKTQPPPKQSYRQTLDKVETEPTEVLVSGDPLNKTMLVNEEDWLGNFMAQEQFEGQEVKHERYGLVVLLSGFIIPVGFSLLRFLPFPSALTTRFNAWIINPPLWGTKHKQPLPGNIGIVPTRGQALFIGYLILINVVLSSVSYVATRPNAWDPPRRQIIVAIGNRVGVLSFANLPLLMLYSSRNNILLKLTNWSHRTFILLHRWVAGIATLQAVIHSIIYLRIYLENHGHAEQSKMPYWIWGIVATLCMCILLPSSVLAIRQKVYEVFLAWHIILSAFTLIGCYYHIILRFENQWGYETWLYTAIAVWSFDRIFRFLKTTKNGLKTAVITDVDDDYVRIDVPGVVATGHVYLYFPTLTWRVWENHPFSVAASILQEKAAKPSHHHNHDDIEIYSSAKKTVAGFEISSTSSDPEKATQSPSQSLNGNGKGQQHAVSLGLTFFLRRRSGLTALIRNRTSLPVLVESSYGTHESTSSYPHLVAIAGGVGITAVLPYLRSHLGSTKLYWGVRSEGIVGNMGDMLKGVEKEVFVGSRMDVGQVVRDEVAASGKGGVMVVVSGPDGMADEVRRVVNELGRKGVRVGLVDEAFSW